MPAATHHSRPGRLAVDLTAVLLALLAPEANAQAAGVGAVAAAKPTASQAPTASVLPSGGPYPQDVVKAVFLYRFAGYVQWPAAALASNRFIIAVMGGDRVAEQLRRLLPDHPIQGEPAQVQRITQIQQLGADQMLYVGPGYDGNLRALIAALGHRPVLVVTDEPGGLQQGGTVNFLLNGQQVRFEVSTLAAKHSGLKISSALLAVAEHVETGKIRLVPGCGPGTGPDPRQQPCLVRIASELVWIGRP